jgi:hypothetical protein
LLLAEVVAVFVAVVVVVQADTLQVPSHYRLELLIP